MISKLVLNIIKAISPRLKSKILNEIIRLILSKAELVKLTVAPHQYNTGVNTNYSEHGQIQTDDIQYRDYGANMDSTIMGTQSPQYRSEYARQIAAMPMDTSENNGQVTLPPIAHQQPTMSQSSYKPALV